MTPSRNGQDFVEMYGENRVLTPLSLAAILAENRPDYSFPYKCEVSLDVFMGWHKHVTRDILSGDISRLGAQVLREVNWVRINFLSIMHDAMVILCKRRFINLGFGKM